MAGRLLAPEGRELLAEGRLQQRPRMSFSWFCSILWVDKTLPGALDSPGDLHPGTQRRNSP